MLVFFLVFAFGFIGYSNLVSPDGYVIISDMTVFWVASHFALAGHASSAYHIPELREAVMAVDPGVKGSFGWFYPPTFYLLVFPLGLLPYLPAYLAFMLPTLAGYVTVVYRIFPRKELLLVLASFSGLWMNLLRGQNGFMTAALAGAALQCIQRRPVLAGVFIGILSIKPHLALLFPVALIAAGAWKTFFSAAVTSTLFMVVATSALGIETFGAWLHSVGAARELMESHGSAYWVHMPTTFALLRLLGVPVLASYVGHGMVALGATVVVWWVWRYCTQWELRGAVLTTATFLISPYLLEYDLTWLALPIAWMAVLGLREGWLRGEREIMIAAWLLPLVSGIVAKALSIQIGPLVLVSMLWMLARRVRIELRENALHEK
jgi:hypothetical protein